MTNFIGANRLAQILASIKTLLDDLQEQINDVDGGGTSVPAVFSISSVMGALHTETIFDRNDIYEANREDVKINDIILNEHLHRAGRVTAINQSMGGTPQTVSTATIPLNDITQLDLSSLVPIQNSNGGSENIVFNSNPNVWSAGSLHSAMNKTPNRVSFSWYFPNYGYDTVIIVDDDGNWGTTSIDNDAISYNASNHILTIKTPTSIVEYHEEGGNFASVTASSGGTNNGVQVLTIAETDIKNNFIELHSADFANVGNVMTPIAVTSLFETLKITGASITVNGNFASLPTNNYYKGIIRQGSSGDIYYEMTDTVTNYRYDAVMTGNATTIDYVQTNPSPAIINVLDDLQEQINDVETSGIPALNWNNIQTLTPSTTNTASGVAGLLLLTSKGSGSVVTNVFVNDVQVLTSTTSASSVFSGAIPVSATDTVRASLATAVTMQVVPYLIPAIIPVLDATLPADYTEEEE